MLLLSANTDVQHGCDASQHPSLHLWLVTRPRSLQRSELARYSLFLGVASFVPIVKTLPRHDSGTGHRHLDRTPTQPIANHYLLTPDT